MNDEYLILDFKNAGLFNNNRKSKDKIFDNIIGNTDRKNVGVSKSPITINQVSNMLHVLFGERPVPINRFSIHKRIMYYDEMANNSYLKINTYSKLDTRLDDENQLYNYQSEIIRVKKAVYNSHSTPNMNWFIIKEYLGVELFNMFKDILYTKYNITESAYTFIEALNIIRENIDDINEFNLFLEQNKKTALVRYIQTGENCTITNDTNPRIKHTYTNGIDNIVRLSGRILVPINYYDKDKLSKCVGCATILDGGIVTINKIQNKYNININDYTKVSQIQTTINENSYFTL